MHSSPVSRPQHGGDIRRFAKEQGLPIAHCVDLSTGISPWSWPVPQIPQAIWRDLPCDPLQCHELIETAAGYYGVAASCVLPVAGSQMAIETLPSVMSMDLNASEGVAVAVPMPGYREHSWCWQNAGCFVRAYDGFHQLEDLLLSSDVRCAVVIQPRNPDARVESPARLLALASQLAQRGGLLIVDEAFVDAEPQLSVTHMLDVDVPEGLLVLRSVGKFFGMAGLRLGFVLAAPELVRKLAAIQPLWSVNGPAVYIGERMLSDTAWIGQQRVRVRNAAHQLVHWCAKTMPELRWRHAQLFVSGAGPVADVQRLLMRLNRAGVHVRAFYESELGTSDEGLLRLGLPSEAQWARLNSCFGDS